MADVRRRGHQVQLKLRRLVELRDDLPVPVRTVAGMDVAYDVSSSRIAGAVTVMDTKNLEIIEQHVVVAEAVFSYFPGLFAFRELPPLLDAMRKVSVMPDLLICDGHGVAHPRRFGLACHVGILTGLPSIGVAKNVLVGDFSDLDPERGAQTSLVYSARIHR